MKNLIITAIFIFVLGPHAFTQEDSTDTGQKKSDRFFSLFESEDPLEISLRFDMKSFMKKDINNKSLEGVLTFHLNKTDSVNSKVGIKYRGINRLERCTFPPIEINFKKPVYAYSDSGKIKNIKLVTHCETGTLYDDYVIREYLVYKLYNVLTDTSFRVRLLKIDYIDTERGRKPVLKYGIFIEPIEILARRTNTNIVKSVALSQKSIIPYVMDRVAIFNYMISNWDWSVAGQHNVKVITPKSYATAGSGIAIPYDFDLTGVVNASFAIPPPDKGIETVRDRLFLGICRSEEEFRKDLNKFLEKKEELYKVINDFPDLNQRSKKDITNFLDQFFIQLEKPKGLDNLISSFIKACKK